MARMTVRSSPQISWKALQIVFLKNCSRDPVKGGLTLNIDGSTIGLYSFFTPINELIIKE